MKNRGRGKRRRKRFERGRQAALPATSLDLDHSVIVHNV
jgi:hypothetical protein